MTRHQLLCAVSLLAPPVVLQGQRPDFSGNWIAARSETADSLPTSPTPLYGTRFGLRMESGVIVQTRSLGATSMASRLPLDGTTAATAIPGRLCEGERMVHETMSWEGDNLRFSVVGMTPAGGGPMAPQSATYTLRMSGSDRLVVEGVIGPPNQRRRVATVYMRTSDSLPPLAPPLPTSGVRATITNIGWIGETWAGTNGTVTTEERWTSPASGGMMATARTLQNGNLSGFEFLCIAERGGTLVYYALPDGRSPATPFVLTAITGTSATFENPGHSYPRTIRYALTQDGRLETTVAGAEGARTQKVTLIRSAPQR